MTVYTVNIVPVFAVASIVYAVSSMTKHTRAELRSRRGEEGSLFSLIAMAVRPLALEMLDRAERCVRVVAVLCEERSLVIGSGAACLRVGRVDVTGRTGGWLGASGSSSTSVTRRSGVVRIDGLESWMGCDTFLNREITADRLRQCRPLWIKGWDHLG